jgi:hypothetical protein
LETASSKIIRAKWSWRCGSSEHLLCKYEVLVQTAVSQKKKKKKEEEEKNRINSIYFTG